ncbi:MAG: hypothetical protein HZC38_19375 [Chloroflexi bacterium]|nr:hypothetical protein [Chloroflexota bacterium]
MSSCALATPSPTPTPTLIPTPTPQPTPTPRPDWITYINPSLGITIQYPKSWRYGPLIENADRYSGEDGFLEVTGFVIEGVSLAGVCAGEINSNLRLGARRSLCVCRKRSATPTCRRIMFAC